MQLDAALLWPVAALIHEHVYVTRCKSLGRPGNKAMKDLL